MFLIMCVLIESIVNEGTHTLSHWQGCRLGAVRCVLHGMLVCVGVCNCTCVLICVWIHRQRKEFLACLEVPEKLASDHCPKEDGAWQFVTESLECESVDEQVLLKETDLIAFYDQFPINDMFRHILMVSSDGEVESVGGCCSGSCL